MDVDEFKETKREMIALLPRLRAFARALTRDQAMADDLVQLGCEKALRNLGGYTPGTRLDAWLFRIIRNSWIDDRRAQRRFQLVADPTELDTMGEDGRDAIHARLELRDVARAMAGMEQEQREVLMLIGVNGMRYREAAEALDIPIGTVMSRLSRARRALAAMVHGETAPGKQGIR